MNLKHKIGELRNKADELRKKDDLTVNYSIQT